MNEDGKQPSKPGPEPDRLKIDGDWEDAIKQAIGKPKPPDGWPDQDDKQEDEETPTE